MTTSSAASSVVFLVLYLISAHTAIAHQGNRLLLIPELTDADFLAVDVHDGRIDEWEELLGEPVVTDADFSLSSFDGRTDRTMGFRMWLSWHGASSRIFVAVETVDDLFLDEFDGSNRQSFYHAFIMAHDTHVGIGVDGDHSGDDSYAGRGMVQDAPHRGAQEYQVIGVKRGGHPIELLWYRDDTEFATLPPYSDVGGHNFSESPSISITESYVTAFDDLTSEPEQSRRSDFRAGHIIGIALKVTDADVPLDEGLPNTYFLPDRWGVVLMDYNSVTEFSNSSFFADAVLLPAHSLDGIGSEDLPVDSWARIKASFSAHSSAKTRPWQSPHGHRTRATVHAAEVDERSRASAGSR